jgi:hypothetical protein
MNRLLCPALLLVILSIGCRRSTEPEKLAGTVQLALFPKSLTKDGVVFEYRLTNRLRGAIYFICPDSACSSDPEWGVQLPFYELNEASVLAVSSYRPRKPFTEISDPYRFKLMKLEAGGTFSGYVILTPPYRTNRPYPLTPEYQPEIIWGPMIDTIRLTIGYYVCPGIEAEPDSSAPADPELAWRKEQTSTYLDCGSDERDRVPEHLISAEEPRGFTGEPPEGQMTEALRWLDEGLDAGR